MRSWAQQSAREHVGTHGGGSCRGAWMYAALHIHRIYTSAIAPPAIVCGWVLWLWWLTLVVVVVVVVVVVCRQSLCTTCSVTGMQYTHTCTLSAFPYSTLCDVRSDRETGVCGCGCCFKTPCVTTQRPTQRLCTPVIGVTAFRTGRWFVFRAVDRSTPKGPNPTCLCVEQPSSRVDKKKIQQQQRKKRGSLPCLVCVI